MATLAMVSGRDRVDGVMKRLVAAGCVAADEEAEELVAGAADEDILEEWVGRREQGEPLPWITGSLQFCGRRVRVDRGVYVPRIQSEELARRAAAALPPTGWAADLCTGAGAVAAHLGAEMPGAQVIGVEIDRRAARCARRNGVRTLVGDLAQPLRPAAFDVVTAVAPYVPTGELRLLPADVQRFEPRQALDGGPDGLDLVRRIVPAAAAVLRPGGRLFLELGGQQDRLLQPALAEAGFGATTAWFDEDGDLRGLAAHRVVD
jgi:release factor glutamine methyltransferase